MTATREAPAFQLALEEDEPPPLVGIMIGVLIGAAFWLLLFGMSVLAWVNR